MTTFGNLLAPFIEINLKTTYCKWYYERLLGLKGNIIKIQ